MKYVFSYFSLLLIAFPCCLYAQTNPSEAPLAPILIDPTRYSGLELEKVEQSNNPQRGFYQGTVFKGEELIVNMLSIETGSADFDPFPIEEFVYLINGKMNLVPTDSAAFSFLPGDFIIAPKGYSGNWGLQGAPDYHLELSVISAKRSEANQLSSFKYPFPIDKDLLAGITMTLEEEIEGKRRYRDTVLAGIELMVYLEAEEASEVDIDQFDKEELIYIISGLVTITPDGGNASTFYTGDFFILPKGFSGTWESNSLDVFRTIRVRSVE